MDTLEDLGPYLLKLLEVLLAPNQDLEPTYHPRDLSKFDSTWFLQEIF